MTISVLTNIGKGSRLEKIYNMKGYNDWKKFQAQVPFELYMTYKLILEFIHTEWKLNERDFLYTKKEKDGVRIIDLRYAVVLVLRDHFPKVKYAVISSLIERQRNVINTAEELLSGEYPHRDSKELPWYKKVIEGHLNDISEGHIRGCSDIDKIQLSPLSVYKRLRRSNFSKIETDKIMRIVYS